MSLRRPTKLYLTDYPIFITLNVINRIWLFDDINIAKLISNRLFAIESITNIVILSYVIMPDHIHILLLIRGKNISKIIQRFKSYTYHEISRHTQIKESFWQKSFDFRIKDTRKLYFKCIDYIKNNSSKAKLDEKYNKFPHYYQRPIDNDTLFIKSN